MATNNQRRGYERKAQPTENQDDGTKALDETQSRDWRIHGPEENRKVQGGSPGKECLRTPFLLIFAAATLAATLPAIAQVSSGSTDAAQQNSASKPQHKPQNSGK